MQKKRVNTKLNFLAVGVVIFTALLCVLPFWVQNNRSGHDIFYHSGVIRSLCLAWDNGTFGSRIMEGIAQDYGYGTGLFYSLIPATLTVFFIKILHLPLFFSVGCVFFLLYSVSGILFYAFVKRISSNAKIAILSAVIYLLNPYSLNCFYVRFSFAECFLLLPLPLIFWGLYELLERSNIRRFFLLFTVGFTLAFYIHFMMSVFITIIGCVYIACYFKHVFQSKKIFALIGATLCVLLTSCAYYIPMLVNYTNVQTDAIASTSWGVYLNTMIMSVRSWVIPCVLANALIIAFFIWIIRKKKWKSLSKNIRCLFILTTTTFAMTLPIFPWFILPSFFGIIQFPFRIFCINQVFLTLSFVYLLKTVDTRKLLKALFYTFCGILYANFLLHGVVIYGDKTLKRDTLTENFVMQTITGMSENLPLGAHKNGDYFPNGTTREYFLKRVNENTIVESEYEITEFAHYPMLNQVCFLITPQEDTFVQLNIPYSVCESVTIYALTTKNNTPVSVDKIENSGQLTLAVAKADETKIILQYTEKDGFEGYLTENPFEFITIDGQAEYSNFVKTSVNEYSVSITSDGATVELPTFYYKGYQITYTVGDTTYELTPTLGENGFITVKVNESGVLRLRFEGKYIKATEVVSAVSIATFSVGAIVWFVVEKRKTKKEN